MFKASGRAFTSQIWCNFTMIKSQKIEWNDSNLTAKASLARLAVASNTENKRNELGKRW